MSLFFSYNVVQQSSKYVSLLTIYDFSLAIITFHYHYGPWLSAAGFGQILWQEKAFSAILRVKSEAKNLN